MKKKEFAKGIIIEHRQEYWMYHTNPGRMVSILFPSYKRLFISSGDNCWTVGFLERGESYEEMYKYYKDNANDKRVPQMFKNFGRVAVEKSIVNEIFTFAVHMGKLKEKFEQAVYGEEKRSAEHGFSTEYLGKISKAD